MPGIIIIFKNNTSISFELERICTEIIFLYNLIMQRVGRTNLSTPKLEAALQMHEVCRGAEQTARSLRMFPASVFCLKAATISWGRLDSYLP